MSLPKEKVGRSGSLSREEVGLSESKELKKRSGIEVLHVILASSRHALRRIKKGNEVLFRQSQMLSKTNVLKWVGTRWDTEGEHFSGSRTLPFGRERRQLREVFLSGTVEGLSLIHI